MNEQNTDALKLSAERGDAGAQFELSQHCLHARDFVAMVHWLEKSSAQENVDAIDALGHCYDKGAGVLHDRPRALELYERAAAQGSSQSSYRLAELLYKSKDSAAQERRIRELLQIAARSGYVLAYRVIGYLALQQASSLDLGLECLQRAAHSGDPASSFKLACHYLERERDTSSALPWLQHAASLQYPFAGELLRELSPSSIDTLPDPPLGEPSLELPFALFPANDDTAARPVSDDPAITVFDGVLDASDCAYLVFLSRPYMQRAHVIDPGGRHDGKVSEVRTSMSTYLPFEIVDFVGRFVERKIVQSVGERFDRSEPMSILRYAPGEYYRPHFDYFNPRLDISAELMKDGGQRVASAVTYLSAPSAGGGTSFPELGLHVPAAAGGTLWFRNCREDGSIDPRSLHAGDTVEHGEKWVVTKWFRERATHYVDF